MIELTQKELEVLSYLIQGYNNPKIAKKMYVTIHTVKAHLGSIYRKFNINSRTAAAYIVGKYENEIFLELPKEGVR